MIYNFRSNISSSDERLHRPKHSENDRNTARKDNTIAKSKYSSEFKVISLNKGKELIDIANQICKILLLKEIKTIK